MNSEQFRRRITQEINRQAAGYVESQPRSKPRTNTMNAGKTAARTAAAKRIERLCPDAVTGRKTRKCEVTSAVFNQLATAAVSRTAADIIRETAARGTIPAGELWLEKARAFQEARRRVLAAVQETQV